MSEPTKNTKVTAAIITALIFIGIGVFVALGAMFPAQVVGAILVSLVLAASGFVVWMTYNLVLLLIE